MTLKEKFEHKGRLLESLKEAVNAKDFDQEKVDTINNDITKTEKEIKSIEKANEFLAQKTEINGEMKQEAPTFWNSLETFFRTGENGVKDRKGPGSSFELRADQLGRVTANKGGSLVPALLGQYIDAARAHIGGMVTPGFCDWQRVGTGNTQTYATLDDTATKAAIVSEAGSLTTGTDVTYGTAVLTFYKWATSFLNVSNELLQDSVYDVAGHVIGLLMERMYRGLNYHFTLGTGSAMPYGIHNLSTKGEDGPSRTIAQADLSNLVYSVNRAYRSGGTWMMNDTTVGMIRALSFGSADDRPLWTESLQAGEPDKLMGYPVVVNPNCDDYEPYNFPIFFGDFKNYKVLEVANGMTIRRVDEL